MLAQVTYIQKFIMADSEDEFIPIFIAASASHNRCPANATRRPTMTETSPDSTIISICFEVRHCEIVGQDQS